MRSTRTLLVVLALAACDGAEPDTSETDDVYDTGDTGAVDTTPPTVTITDDVPGTAAGDVTFTFTFSEDVGDSFDAQDVAVTGGTAGAFDAQGTSATLVVSPLVDQTGTLEVTVAVGTFEDTAGNANTQGATASQAYDTTVSVTQTMLIDFESTEPPVFAAFGNVFASVVQDPTDSANRVARLVKQDSAEPWGGNTMSYCPDDGIAELPFTAAHTSISMRVWSPDADTPFRIKVEDSSDPDISVETEARSTTAATWQTLVFDFSKHAAGTPALDLSSTYDKLSVFPNFGTFGADVGEKTYYVDDIAFLQDTFDNECPEVIVSPGLLDNGGFEDWPAEGLADGWLIFPGDLTNFGKVCTGDTMFNTTDTFTAYEGDCAIKVFGRYDTGNASETPIYQEVRTSAGQTYTMSAWVYMHEADAIAATDTDATLWLKYYDDSYNYFGNSVAASITSGSPTNTWVQLEVTGTVPEGATRVQAALEFLHCNGVTTGDCYTGGGVYYDDVRFAEVK